MKTNLKKNPIQILTMAAAVLLSGASLASTAQAQTIDTDVLREGQAVSYSTTLPAGELVMYMAGGDSDALDIDLEVYDPYGNKVAWDYADDAAPVASFATLVPGTYTIRLIMVDTYFGRPAIYVLERH